MQSQSKSNSTGRSGHNVPVVLKPPTINIDELSGSSNLG